MPLRLLPLILLAGGLLLACASSDDTPAEPADDPKALQSASWILRQYDAGGALVEAADRSGSLTFDPDGSLPGSTGCNRFIGTWEAEGNNLTLAIGPTTLMACPEPLMAQESAVLAALPRTATYSLTDGMLTLTASSGEPVAVYEQAADDLAGTAWQATGVNDGKGAVVSTQATGSQNLLFDGAGGVSGYGGCTSFSGSYTTDGDAIRFTDLAQDEPCEPGDEADRQAEFLAALNRSTSFRIDGTRLDLRDENGARQANFTELAIEESKSPSP